MKVANLAIWSMNPLYNLFIFRFEHFKCLMNNSKYANLFHTQSYALFFLFPLWKSRPFSIFLLFSDQDHFNKICGGLIAAIKTGPSSRWQPQIIVQKSEPHELSYHETPVTDNHIRSRALMSSFVVAAAKAINEFGVSSQIFL